MKTCVNCGGTDLVELEKPAAFDALTHADLMDLLEEECAEVIQAAKKCDRFGFERTFQSYGHNGTRLFEEMGDLVAVIFELVKWHPRLRDYFLQAQNSNIDRALNAKRGRSNGTT